MTRSSTRLFLFGVCWISFAAWGGWASAEEPAAPIRVLILTGQNNHNWSESTPKLRNLLEAAGGFSVATTVPPQGLTREPPELRRDSQQLEQLGRRFEADRSGVDRRDAPGISRLRPPGQGTRDDPRRRQLVLRRLAGVPPSRARVLGPGQDGPRPSARVSGSLRPARTRRHGRPGKIHHPRRTLEQTGRRCRGDRVGVGQFRQAGRTGRHRPVGTVGGGRQLRPGPLLRHAPGSRCEHHGKPWFPAAPGAAEFSGRPPARSPGLRRPPAPAAAHDPAAARTALI